MLTSFESFDALAGHEASTARLVATVQELARAAVNAALR